MVDTVAILISHALILYTVFHAVKLDQRLPWFRETDDDKRSQKSEEDDPGRSQK